MKTKILTILLITSLMAGTAIGAGLSSARSVAMGGAYIGLAKGVRAALYNPANIGLNEYRQNGLELAAAGVQITNNSFTLNDFNEYTGALLTDDDKSTILGKIPKEGLKVSVEAEAGVLSLSLDRLVVSINGYAATETNLGKDALQLFLEGNTLGESFSMEGMYSEALAYASIGVSSGMSVYTSGTRQVALGATVRYLRGIAYERVTELRGGVVTLATGLDGEGTMIARTATGGQGYAVDIGAAIKLNDSYTAGIAFSNVLGSINWTDQTEEHGYHFQFDTLTAGDFDNDSLIVTDEYSRDIDAFSSSLPVLMKAGLAKTSGRFNWAVDWTQGFEVAAGSSSKPRLAAGVQYRLIPGVPFRAGYSIGGDKGSVFSIGSGLNLPLFYLDIALSNNSTFDFEDARGVHLAASIGFEF